MIEVAMGRPKKKGKTPEEGKTIGVRVSAAYGAWVERLAKANQSSVAVLFAQALKAYAKKIEFEEEPPDR